MSQPDPPLNEPPRGDNPFAEPLTGFRFKDAPDQNEGELAGCLMPLILWPWWLWLWLVQILSAGETFHVPARFGMSAIIGITTSLALLFALLRGVDAHPLVYVFCTLLVLIIVVVQMRWGHVARPASIVAGAAWLPLFVLSLVVLSGRRTDVCATLCSFPFIVLLGGFFGYLAGTCAGGFFLLMDMLEKYWDRRTGSAPPPTAKPPESQLDDLSDPR
jgi:hypothetical protein